MRFRTKAALGLVSAIGLLVSSGVAAHESENDGHIPANVNYGFELIGRDTLGGVEDGRYTDVWSHEGYAYVGTFQNPDCTNAGVFIVDVAAAIANYPDTTSSTVGEIKSAPNTRVNDVKVHTVGETDVLVATQEPCGATVPGGAVSDANINKACPLGEVVDENGEPIVVEKPCNRNNDNGNKDEPGRRGPGAPAQKGGGGISLYDVTDPTNPTPLNKGFLDFGGVHNTFMWDWEGRSYLIGTANTFDFFDTFFVDITNPKKPELLSITGALDWIPAGLNLDQLETGQSAGIFNHDVWVEVIDGTPTAVVPYWDLGFVTLDVSDPANPVFLGDSTFPETDPLGRAYEGNAHAAIFGANGDIIVGGDEDFDPATFAVTFEGESYPAGSADFGPSTSDVPLAGDVIWTGGEGCSSGEVPVATAEGQIALIQRGTCEFATKGARATEAGYAGYIVANDEARGDALITMAPGVESDAVLIPGVFVGYSTGEIMKGGGSISEAGLIGFNGWGYLRVLNNVGGDVDVPGQSPGPDPTISVGQLGEIGFYAPAETLEEPEGDPLQFGDLTMHNLIADPTTQDVTPTFDGGPRFFVSWYSLGMRAIEYRPGHWHTNANGEGSYSWNVHEVGRYIDDQGSNFWGVHLDEVNGEQVILASDRNLGLYVFTFGCEDEVEGPFYCQRGTDDP